MPKSFRGASFAAALTLALLTLPALTAAAHGHAVGHSLVSASGIGWDTATPAAATASAQTSGIGWD